MIKLLIISLLLTACNTRLGSMKCAMNPTVYKEIYRICLMSIDKNSPKMVRTCEKVTWDRTKYCY